MSVLNYIGKDTYGGHARYAHILNEVILETGRESFVNSRLEDITTLVNAKNEGNNIVLIFHSMEGVSKDTIESFRHLGVKRMIAWAHNPRAHILYKDFDIVVPVSRYVRDILLMTKELRIEQPAYIAASKLGHPRGGQDEVPAVYRASEYMWDKRKFRDLICSMIEPVSMKAALVFNKAPSFDAMVKHPVLHLGIVSRLARLKNFPRLAGLLFASIKESTPPNFYLHVIGAGPWREVRSFKASIPQSVRGVTYFWGWQAETKKLMQKLDALLLGYPEQEALGLNALEATLAQIPIIAIRGGPFEETVEHGVNGWLISEQELPPAFLDALHHLNSIRSGCAPPLSFSMSTDYQARFSDQNFTRLVCRLIN